MRRSRRSRSGSQVGPHVSEAAQGNRAAPCLGDLRNREPVITLEDGLPKQGRPGFFHDAEWFARQVEDSRPLVVCAGWVDALDFGGSVGPCALWPYGDTLIGGAVETNKELVVYEAVCTEQVLVLRLDEDNFKVPRGSAYADSKLHGVTPFRRSAPWRSAPLLLRKEDAEQQEDDGRYEVPCDGTGDGGDEAKEGNHEKYSM